MAAFGQDEDGALDWTILRDGGISLYRNRKYLSDDAQWLALQGYRILNVECATWSSHDAIHESLEKSLSFPAYYGRNFNALKDCLWDLEVPSDGGLALVLNSYGVYANGLGSANQKTGMHDAKTVLHILAGTSRYFLLFGRRFIVLVQSNDPSMSFEGLGGVATQWNRREWLNKDRGLA
jgi:hypothetical protein